MKYNEYHPTEIGTSKNAWSWFPCQLEPNGEIHYTNGHIVTTKPPVKNWPTEAPEKHMLTATRCAAFRTPLDASKLFHLFYADGWPAFVVAGSTERVSRTNRNDYEPGHVTLLGDKYPHHTTTLGRHYYALAVEMYGKDCTLEFRQKEPGTAVQVRRNNKTVALIMPIKETIPG